MAVAVIHTDGGSRGNPGPAGIGFTIDVADDRTCRGGAFIGHATNNIAEYSALVWALENAKALGYKQVEVRADSELLVKQILGVYKVKNPGIRPLFDQAKRLLADFSKTKVVHVRREFNRDADALANEAMDRKEYVGDYAVEFGAATQDSLF